MADYQVSIDGKVKRKKKKQSPAFKVGFDGKIIKASAFQDEDIAPTKKTTVTTSSDDRTWFQKSKGTVGQKILGSGTDLLENLGTGLIRMGETAVDAFASLAPAMSNMQKINNGQMLTDDDWKEYDRQKKKAEEFIKKDLYDEETVAKKIITAPIEKRTGIDAESMSVFGEKSDSLVQSAGQLGGTALLQMAHVPWWLTTGVTSFGGEVEGALTQGATMEEAQISGAISAGTEILTEKISGGIKFGGKTLDDALTKQLSKTITNKTVRTLSKIGIDVLGEGGEEVLSGYLSAIGQKLTYAKEKELNEIFSTEDALESFIGGAVLGGVSGGGKAVVDAAKGNDYASGLTKSEKAVVDKVYKDAVAERETDGKKLTQSEKSKLYDDTLKRLDKGYIDIDTIESVLGGETYNKLKSVTDNETKLREEYDSMKKEYDTLNKMKLGEMTGEQTDRKAELKNKLEELKENLKNSTENSNKTQLRTQLDSEMSKIVEGSKLSESYSEKARRGQELEIDVESYKNESAKQTAQNFKDFGANNTNASHDYLDLVTKVAEDRGQTFKFMTTKQLEEAIAKSEYNVPEDSSKVEAFIDKGKKEIIINMDANKSLNSLVGHEITHTLEGDKTSYDSLQKTLFTLAETRGEYDARWESIQRRYSKEKGYTEEQQLQELTSDLVGDYIFGNSDFIANLSTENPNIFKKIYNEIKYLWKMATAGSKEQRQLETAKKKFEDAWRQANNTSIDADVKLFVSEKTENVSDRLSGREWNQVKSAVADYSKLNYHYEKSSNGDIIIPVNNKLVYTDANFDSPGIRKVIEVDSEYEDEVDIARRLIYESEKGKYSLTDAYEIIEEFIGQEVIHEYNQKGSSNAKGYDRRTGRGKSRSDSYHSSFLQERIRRANEIINSVNKGQTSSEDGVFFDGENGDVRFSLADTVEETLADSTPSKEYGNHIYSKDVALDIPTKESLTTDAESLPVMEESLPIRSDHAPLTEAENEHIPGEDLTRKNAERIRTIKAEIEGHKLTRDITSKEFSERIAQKESEYESLKHKDTKKAVNLRNQITRLETKRDSLLKDLDNKIERANKRIEGIEQESRVAKRQSKTQEYRELFGRLMGDTSTWVDKKFGINYQTNTLRRNLRDIVRDASGKQDIARADAIYDELQGSVNRNEASKNREANALKNPFKDMKINNVESTYIQMLGELRHNPDSKLTKEVVDEFYKKHKGRIDTQKVDRAIDEARKLYDSLYDRVNAALSEHGFKEIGYRKGYFPHFNDPKQNWLSKLLNWKVNNVEIPTDIAGLTEMFEPQRTWQSFDKHRTSDTTDYNFLKGLDNYVNGSLDWIYHIEDIQKHRAFENEIRYRHSSEAVQKKIDEYRNNPMLSNEEVETLIQSALKEAKNPLNNFVTDLHTRTNILAGKKSSKDRKMESDLNRHAYSVMTNITNRVTANQVVGSVSSALTNFIPITQSWGQVNPTSSLVGMKKTIQSYMSDDGVVSKSDFLTNRLAQNEALHKDAWDKIGDKVGGLMEIVDNFTSQTVWRSKYYENIKKGMSEEQAIKDADQFAENVIGGRSKGNMPTIFHAKNPVTKMLTSFQLEVANQYGYMFKDMPQDIGKNAIGKLTKGYATMFIGSYVYNALYSSLTGRDAAFDPIGIIQEFIGDLGGDDEEEKDVAGAIGGLASNVADEIPFVGGLLGGGRIPISSALPYNASISDAYADVVDGDWKSVLDELSKPLYYGVLPMGGGQIRKTVQGLSMFDDDLPVSGSYTKSGNLRFPVEDTFLNRLQAGVFGQYASENAREYFDRGQAPLKEKQIQEYKDVDIPISEYWDYRDGLKGLKTLSDKADYINSLDLPIDKKNILVNNQSDRKEPIDLTGFDDKFESFEEFDFAIKNPDKYEIAMKVGGYKKYKEYKEGMKGMTKLAEKGDYIASLNIPVEHKNALINGETDRKTPIDMTGFTSEYKNFEEFDFATRYPDKYKVLEDQGVSVHDYLENEQETAFIYTDDYSWAADSPAQYSISKVISDDVKVYRQYTSELSAIKADKDSNGKSISGSAKKKKTEYINSLDLDYGQRIILYRSLFDSNADKNTYNPQIVEYLDSRDDITPEEMQAILESLDMKVHSDGRITW